MAQAALPLGLAELNKAPSVIVHQKTSVKNKYRVFTPEGKEILYAKEDSSFLHAMFSGKNRSLDIDILDANNVKVINLRRPHTFGPDKMEVTMTNQVVSIVRQESTFFKPVIRVNDASDRPVMRIKGPMMKSGPCEYDIFDCDKKQIGVINKNWSGLGREMFTDSDSYEIVFPKNLDLRFKAALLGACFLIDFIYYEN